MNQRNEEWIAEAVVETTPAYEALDPHAFYVNMAEMAQAWQAEREAEQAAQATASPAAETPAAEPRPRQLNPKPPPRRRPPPPNRRNSLCTSLCAMQAQRPGGAAPAVFPL